MKKERKKVNKIHMNNVVYRLRLTIAMNICVSEALACV